MRYSWTAECQAPRLHQGLRIKEGSSCHSSIPLHLPISAEIISIFYTHELLEESLYLTHHLISHRIMSLKQGEKIYFRYPFMTVEGAQHPGLQTPPLELFLAAWHVLSVMYVLPWQVLITEMWCIYDKAKLPHDGGWQSWLVVAKTNQHRTSDYFTCMGHIIATLANKWEPATSLRHHTVERTEGSTIHYITYLTECDDN